MDGYWLVDTEQRILEVNDSYCQMSGYSYDELLKMKISDLESNEDSKDISDRIKRILSTGFDRFITRHKRKDGTYFFVEISVTYLSTDENYFVVFINDITDRMKVLEDLTKFSKAVEQSPVSIVITNNKGIIEYVNPKFCELTSYSKEEAIGQNPRILKSGQTPPEYFRNLWQTILSGNKWYGELLNKKKNGDLYWEAVSISPIFNNQNQITHFIGVKEDITDRKKYESDLNELNNELTFSHKLTQEALYDKNVLLEELLESEEKLKETVASKDKFFSIIAHDLRGPFSGFLGLTDLMAKEADEISVKDIKKMSEAINKAAISVYKLIEDLLIWSRSQTGSISFYPERLNLTTIINDIINSLKQLATDKNIKLTNIIESDLTLEFDKNMITTLIRNLLSNSIKFTNAFGKIEIGLYEDSKSISEDEICLYVQDNGAGIPESKIDQLFNIGQHYTTRGTNNEIGTGLGLILCKEFIEKHNGKIWVKSTEGQGSTFYFTLKKSLK
jgi:PAS domain S-box-containing protein